MYILQSGEAKVIRAADAGVLTYLGEGDYFGERALLRNEPRQASVVAVTAVACLSLSRESFDSLLTAAPQLREQLGVRLGQYQQAAEAAGQALPEPPTAPSPPPPPDLAWERIDVAAERPPPRPPRGWRRWFPFAKPYPSIAQEDETDCGAAALAMIGRFNGVPLSLARLCDLAHVRGEGASMLGLAQAARHAGFDWRAVLTDFDHLAGLPLPAVAHWKGYHYLVLYEVRGDRAVVGDPAAGILKMSRAEAEAQRRFEKAAARPGAGAAPAGQAWSFGILQVVCILTVAFSARLVLDGDMTAGQFLAFQVLVGLAVAAVLDWLGLWPELRSLPFVLGKLAEVQEVPAEPEGEGDRPALPAVRGFLRLEDVRFRYHPESPEVLAGVNLEIAPGHLVAVVGRAGAGKSTLARLCQRLDQPTHGIIRIDGVDIGSVEVGSLREQLSVVPEAAVLFAATVRANIALAEGGAPLARVIEAARLANAHEFIMSLPRGYDTLLGPGGVRLSGGQAQCVALARAFLKQPRVLILDEALSALDGESEQVVLHSLRGTAHSRTTILCTRRPPPFLWADLVVVLDRGQVVETGSHQELSAQQGLYAFWARRPGV
jgi:ABC-type bacteriocin/lantibiotic exporter with double-glycine peptidase domain